MVCINLHLIVLKSLYDARSSTFCTGFYNAKSFELFWIVRNLNDLRGIAKISCTAVALNDQQ